MEFILIFFFSSVLLFENIQSEKSKFLKEYEETVSTLATNGLKDTKYCESILLPSEQTFKKTLQSTFFNAKSDTVFDGKDRIDLCCRSLHKCDALKHIELNQTTVWTFWHCDCVHSFQICLNNLNTTLSNEFAFIHSLNTTKCFSNDHPIVKCNRFEKYPDSVVQLFKLSNLDEREKYFKRCEIYELDRNRGKELQIFDMPFNVDATATVFVTNATTPQPNISVRNELVEIGKENKLNSTIELVNYILKVVKIGKNIGCDVARLIETLTKKIQSDNAGVKEERSGALDLLHLSTILIDTICKNMEIIESMEHNDGVETTTTTSVSSSDRGLGPFNIYGGNVNFYSGCSCKENLPSRINEKN